MADSLVKISPMEYITPKDPIPQRILDASKWFTVEVIELDFGDYVGRPAKGALIRVQFLTYLFSNGWYVSDVMSGEEGGEWKSVNSQENATSSENTGGTVSHAFSKGKSKARSDTSSKTSSNTSTSSHTRNRNRSDTSTSSSYSTSTSTSSSGHTRNRNRSDTSTSSSYSTSTSTSSSNHTKNINKSRSSVSTSVSASGISKGRTPNSNASSQTSSHSSCANLWQAEAFPWTNAKGSAKSHASSNTSASTSETTHTITHSSTSGSGSVSTILKSKTISRNRNRSDSSTSASGSASTNSKSKTISRNRNRSDSSTSASGSVSTSSKSKTLSRNRNLSNSSSDTSSSTHSSSTTTGNSETIGTVSGTSEGPYWFAYVRLRLKRRKLQAELVMKDMVEDLTKAYNEGRKVNDERYDEIVSLYSIMLGRNEDEGNNFILQTSDLKPLTDSVLRSMKKTIDDFHAVADSLPDDFFKNRVREINLKFDNQLSTARVTMITSGLYNSTTWTTTEAGIERNREMALNDLIETKIDVYVKVANASSDIGTRFADAASRMQQMFKDRLLSPAETRNNVFKWMLDFMERRKDEFPSLEHIAGATKQFGSGDTVVSNGVEMSK